MSKLLDISGNNNNGTINGPLLTTTGMKFDGVDDYVEIPETSLNITSSGATFCFRYKANATGIILPFIGRTTLAYSFIEINSGDQITIESDTNGDSAVTSDFTANTEWNDIIVVIDSGVVSMYQNGTPLTVSGTLSDDLTIDKLGRNRNISYFNGELADAKIYNYAFTPQEAKNYHNSFIRPTLIESFENYPVGSIANPQGTGVYSVSEKVIEQGELVTNGGFDSDTGWTKQADWTISSGTADYGANTSPNYIRQTITLKTGSRYRVKFDIVSGIANIGFSTIAAGTMFSDLNGYNLYTVGSYSIDTTASATSGLAIYAINIGGGTAFSIDNISVTEIPPLPSLTTGTKELVCDTLGNGTYPIQSKQAYGEWEFDWYKNTGGYAQINFISDRINTGGGYDFYGYKFFPSGIDGGLYFRRANNGSSTILFNTASSYIAINTDYRIKVARLKSSGVFKDIPTLQVSDMENYDYDSFTTSGRYGFSAISTVGGTQKCNTADEIAYVNGESYLVEFDAKLNSGQTPSVRFATAPFAGAGSNIVTLVEGRNSAILTPTSTTTGILQFYTTSATDYEISGLQIRQIYDANTFWVGIKGGSFVADPDAENGFVTVDTTGGSGQNPVTDATYTESEYFVADLDSGDKISNIKIYNQVEV